MISGLRILVVSQYCGIAGVYKNYYCLSVLLIKYRSKIFSLNCIMDIK